MPGGRGKMSKVEARGETQGLPYPRFPVLQASLCFRRGGNNRQHRRGFPPAWGQPALRAPFPPPVLRQEAPGLHPLLLRAAGPGLCGGPASRELPPSPPRVCRRLAAPFSRPGPAAAGSASGRAPLRPPRLRRCYDDEKARALLMPPTSLPVRWRSPLPISVLLLPFAGQWE